jgi:mannose-6-phosphate isomerase-like protein (cupin superfamily)
MLIHIDQIPAETLQNVRGGEGPVLAQKILSPEAGSAIKGIGITRLPPGSSVGWHEHHGEEDFYFCLSGEGIVLDHDQEKPFTPGTFQITRSGQAQAIRNTGSVDLVFLGGLVASVP